jgi:hypothetical protein
MAHATLASDSPLVVAAPAEYRPGVCNIGPAEIRRRRRVGHVGLGATAALLAGLVAVDAPPIARMLLGIPATLSASGYLQARLKFCAGFGQLGVFNFGDRGDRVVVADEAARAADRRRARQISMASFGVGLAVAVVAVLLPA